MAGLEGWTFPQDWQLVEGDRLVTAWRNRLPGRRADGSFFEAPGMSVLRARRTSSTWSTSWS
jgi:hypothetical protein